MACRGPVALVTGAAQGIGFAICDRLLQEGYRVCLTDVNEENGKYSVSELQRKYAADKVFFLKCDVTSESNFREVFLKIGQIFGKIDLLVNNAGIANEFNPQLTVDINLMGPIIGCRQALKLMGTSNGGKGGTVINVASILGHIPHANLPVYTATKHGVIGLTRSYGNQHHFERDGITFMAICPFYVRTELLKTWAPLENFNKEEIKKAMQPEFVAEGVMKLLRDRHNGSTLGVIPAEHFYVEIEEKLLKITM